jgi:hypothetical protein
MWFTVCEQDDPVALRFMHHRRGIFSALLEASHSRMPSLAWE